MKFLKVLLVLSIVLVSIINTFAYDYRDTVRINNLASTAYTIEINVQDSSVSSKQMLAELQSLSVKYVVSFVKVTASYDGGVPVISYSGVFNDVTFPVQLLAITSGHFIESDNELLASYATGSIDQVGEIFAFTHGSKVVVNTLSSFYESKGIVDGTYRVISSQPYDSSALLNELAVFLDTDSATLTKQTHGESIGESDLVPIGVAALAIVALVFVLFISSISIKRSKEIAIERLQGWSNLQIWKTYLKGTVMTAVITAIVVDAALLIYIGRYSSDFLVILLVSQIAVYLAFVLLSMFLLLIISRRKMAEALKESSSLRIPFVIAGLTKIGYMALLVAFSLIISPILGGTLSGMRAQQAWLEHGDLYVLSNFTATSDDMDDVINGGSGSMERFSSIYPLLNDKYGAIYANGLDHPYASTDTQDLSVPQSLTVNPNYLKAYPLLDSNGQAIVIPETESAPVVLIPQSQESNKDVLLDKLLPWSSWDSMPDQSQVKVIIYQDSAPLFSFNDTFGADTGYYLKSPVVEVLTEANVGENYIWNIQVNGVDAPVKLPAGTNIQALQIDLQQTAVADNDLKFDTIKNSMAEQIRAMQASSGLLLAIYIALFAASVFVSTFLVQIILLSRKKWLLVAKLHGLSFFERYRTETVAYLIVAIFALLIAFAFSQNLTAIPLLLSTIFVDILILFFYIRYLEKKNLATQLKGA